MTETDKAPNITLDNADVVFKDGEYVTTVFQSPEVKEWAFEMGFKNQLNDDSQFPGENPGYHQNERVATPTYLDGPFHLIISKVASEDLRYVLEHQTDFAIMDF